jgi:hypothetical protein
MADTDSEEVLVASTGRGLPGGGIRDVQIVSRR